MEATTPSAVAAPTNNVVKNARANIPGDVPVIEVGRKLLALHKLKTSKGEDRFALSEVVPAKMKGREVQEWTGVYQGVSIWFETPVQAEEFFERALREMTAFKVT